MRKLIDYYLIAKRSRSRGKRKKKVNGIPCLCASDYRKLKLNCDLCNINYLKFFLMKYYYGIFMGHVWIPIKHVCLFKLKSANVTNTHRYTISTLSTSIGWTSNEFQLHCNQWPLVFVFDFYFIFLITYFSQLKNKN